MERGGANRSGTGTLLLKFLGEPEENSFGTSNIAEPIRVFVLDDVADELRAIVTSQPTCHLSSVHPKPWITRPGAIKGDRKQRARRPIPVRDHPLVRHALVLAWLCCLLRSGCD